ncbi:MAG: hypothetical protein A2Y17_13435 [Clostridiales bacterium GWF2_38_85]|nr:MAG: hypothetical protein A2Y17_13435 [Clostridiales bacterium GWF2_38_85]
MKFSIISVILWSRNRKNGYRKVDFEQNGVNIITGASRTGKSAIIPIIDYCLGASECTIPVGVIRDACDWFGVLFNLENEQLLLCRREPGSQAHTGDMFFTRGKNVEIPDEPIKNTTVEQVKNALNEIFSMSFIELDPTSNDNFSSRPSYRDLMAFSFQPQNVIANNRVLFYNIEKMEHKKKLINIFPYVLGAITAETLAANQERERLTKERDRLARELDNIKFVSNGWKQEVLTWLSQARELGLTSFRADSDTDFNLQVDELKRIADKSENDSAVVSSNIRDMSEELKMLRASEQELSIELSIVQQRYDAMEKLSDSKKRYDESLRTQINRLDISGWLRSLSDSSTCPICGDFHDTPVAELDMLCTAMAEIEKQTDSVQAISMSFDREFNIVKSEIDLLSEKLTAIRKRIAIESSRSQEDASKKYTLASVSRFLGRMEFAIKTYERMGTDSELVQRLSALNDKIGELNNIASDSSRKAKEKAALSFIQQEANTLIKMLDVESPDDPIEFIVSDLTIRIKTALGRDNYLWEIGSASNWLAYHLAISLAFQKYFQERGGVNIPNIMIYDQPSQVYFPQQRLPENASTNDDAKLLADEDKAAVKKIFETLSNYIQNSKNPFQIIVMEHADEDIWGKLANTHLVARWRDNEKLIPLSWLQ